MTTFGYQWKLWVAWYHYTSFCREIIGESNHKEGKNGFFCYQFITMNRFIFVWKKVSCLLSPDCCILMLTFITSESPSGLQQLSLNCFMCSYKANEASERLLLYPLSSYSAMISTYSSFCTSFKCFLSVCVKIVLKMFWNLKPSYYIQCFRQSMLSDWPGWMGKTLSSLILMGGIPAWGWEVGTRWSLRPLPNQTMLWLSITVTFITNFRLEHPQYRCHCAVFSPYWTLLLCSLLWFSQALT